MNRCKDCASCFTPCGRADNGTSIDNFDPQTIIGYALLDDYLDMDLRRLHARDSDDGSRIPVTMLRLHEIFSIKPNMLVKVSGELADTFYYKRDDKIQTLYGSKKHD